MRALVKAPMTSRRPQHQASASIDTGNTTDSTTWSITRARIESPPIPTATNASVIVTSPCGQAGIRHPTKPA